MPSCAREHIVEPLVPACWVDLGGFVLCAVSLFAMGICIFAMGICISVSLYIDIVYICIYVYTYRQRDIHVFGFVGSLQHSG